MKVATRSLQPRASELPPTGSEKGKTKVNLYFLSVHGEALEVFKNHVDVALSRVVSGHGRGGLNFGLDDVRGLFLP